MRKIISSTRKIHEWSKRKAGSGALGLLILLLGSATACDTAVRSRPEPSDPVRVEVGTVRTEQLSERTGLTGTVESIATAELTARVMAEVRSVSVEQGDRVAQGQLVIRLDNRELQAGLEKIDAAGRELELMRDELQSGIQAARSQLAQAEAGLTLAQVTFKRFETLIQKEAVSGQEFDEVVAKRDGAKAAVGVAEANLQSLNARLGQLDARESQMEADRKSATTRLDFTEIRAPFAGFVLNRHVDPGDLASPSAPLITLERPSYRLNVAVEESLLPKLEMGDSLPVEIPSIRRTLTGRVSQIAPGGDPRTRTVQVKVALPEDPSLRSGLFGRIQFEVDSRAVLTVPREALVERGQLQGVFVVQDGRASFRVLRLGRRLEDRTVVLSGLSESLRVILDPSSEIRDGIPVQVVSQAGGSS